jgi:hypothetical protein
MNTCFHRNMVYVLLLLIVTSSIGCAQAEKTQERTKQKITFSERRILEAEVQYPASQMIKLTPISNVQPSRKAGINYIGYEKGTFKFEILQEEEAPFVYNFYFDNKEPVLTSALNLEMDLPEGDHIIGVCLLDSLGHGQKTSGTSLSKMIRIKDGEIIKIADGGTLMFYNQPRKEYSQGESVYLDFCIPFAPLDESFELIVLIDSQRFEIESDKTYQIEGLKPGIHMAELQLFRFGQMYNAPLNPARMTFMTK